MVALLDGAQIKRVLVCVGHDIAKAIDIERARPIEVRHAEFDMAGAHDVERRIEDRIAEGHWIGVSRSAVVTLSFMREGGERSEPSEGFSLLKRRDLSPRAF